MCHSGHVEARGQLGGSVLSTAGVLGIELQFFGLAAKVDHFPTSNLCVWQGPFELDM